MAEAIVCVWMPGRSQMGGFGRVVRFLGVGHAAVRVLTNKAKVHYITWAAQGDPFNSLTHPMQRFKRLGEVNEDGQLKYGYDEDKVNMEGFFGHGEPDYKVPMPTLSISGNGINFGVNVKRIVRFWKERLKNNDYSFLSKKNNCTGCVAEALRAGGLGCFVEKGKFPFVQDARTLRVWAQLGQEKLRALNDRQGMINAVMNMLAVKHSDVLNAGVPSVEEWTRDSDSKIKFRLVAQRHDQIANLDMLIREYPNAQTALSKFTYLIKMQSEIYSHFTTKPNSDRKEAVTKLGARVTGALRRLNVSPNAVDDLSDDAYELFMSRLAWNTEGV